MSYVARSLGCGEKIVYQTRLHWRIFFRAILFLLFVIGFAAFPDDDIRAIWGLPFFFACVFGFGAFIKRACSEFVITNQRIVLKSGLIHHHLVDLYLSSVSSVQVEQGLWGSILGYGTVVVVSHGTKESFPKIARPLEFRRMVYEAKQGKGG